MKNNGLVFCLPAIAALLAFLFTVCDTGIGGNTKTNNDVETVSLANVKSIQEEIDNNTEVIKNPDNLSSGKLISAIYNTGAENYTLLYKIGRINDLFSHYVTSGIPGGKGYGITYTTNVSTVNSASLSATVSSSISFETGIEIAVLKSSMETTFGVSISATQTITGNRQRRDILV